MPENRRETDEKTIIVQNGSKLWMYTVRVIIGLGLILQSILVYWAKWITSEAANSKAERASIQESVKRVEADGKYLRERFDRQFDRK